MYLFKASGATYRKVVRQTVHAFPYSPAEATEDEFVLLAKKLADCAQLEKQVQNVAKLLKVRRATATELDTLFPGVAAGLRWTFVAELYWLRPLVQPFHLRDVPGFDSRRYSTVQEFAKLDDRDARALLAFLTKTNSAVVLDFLNNAERP